jgi:cytochrome c biogenesis protein CcmG/thiol:disulfide interchange protein DsbE
MTPGTGVKIAAAAAVVVSIVLAVALSTRFGSDPNIQASPLIGQRAPDVTVTALDGSGDVRLADLEGDIVVVNFFASWCPGCRTEHRVLIAASNAYADRGVQLVQIAYDDDPSDTRRFLDELGRADDTLYLTDQSSAAAIGFGLRGVPETYFIDRNGIVQGKISGETDALLLAETIDTMLAGDAPGAKDVGEVQSRP